MLQSIQSQLRWASLDLLHMLHLKVFWWPSGRCWPVTLTIDLNSENYTNDLRRPHGLSCCFWAGFASFWDASNVLKLWMWTWPHVLIKPMLGCSGWKTSKNVYNLKPTARGHQLQHATIRAIFFVALMSIDIFSNGDTGWWSDIKLPPDHVEVSYTGSIPISSHQKRIYPLVN